MYIVHACLNCNLANFDIPNGFLHYGNNFGISKLTRLHFKWVCTSFIQVRSVQRQGKIWTMIQSTPNRSFFLDNLHINTLQKFSSIICFDKFFVCQQLNRVRLGIWAYTSNTKDPDMSHATLYFFWWMKEEAK